MPAPSPTERKNQRLSEEQIIAALGRLKCSQKNLLRGDDVGAFKARGHIFAATDSLIEGIHYRSAWLLPRDIAYKLFARNYSDFAVKGIRPEFALLNLGLSAEHATIGFVRPFLRELDLLFTRFGITLIGGDTAHSPHDHFTLSFFGNTGKLIARKAKEVKPGDLIFQIGAVGGSDAARMHLEQNKRAQQKDIKNFTRPVFLQAYPHGFSPSAAIDQSDSVEKTLRLLAEANNAELEINLECVQTAKQVGPVNEQNALQVMSAAEDLAVFGILPAGGRVRGKSSPAFRLIGKVKYIHKARARVSYNLNGRKFAHRAKSFEHFG